MHFVKYVVICGKCIFTFRVSKLFLPANVSPAKCRTAYQKSSYVLSTPSVRIYCLCIVTALPNETATWENIASFPFFIATRVMCFSNESEELQRAFARMQYIPEAFARKALVRNKQTSSERMSPVATEWKICFDRLATSALSCRRTEIRVIDYEMKKVVGKCFAIRVSRV